MNKYWDRDKYIGTVYIRTGTSIGTGIRIGTMTEYSDRNKYSNRDKIGTVGWVDFHLFSS